MSIESVSKKIVDGEASSCICYIQLGSCIKQIKNILLTNLHRVEEWDPVHSKSYSSPASYQQAVPSTPVSQPPLPKVTNMPCAAPYIAQMITGLPTRFDERLCQIRIRHLKEPPMLDAAFHPSLTISRRSTSSRRLSHAFKWLKPRKRGVAPDLNSFEGACSQRSPCNISSKPGACTRTLTNIYT